MKETPARFQPAIALRKSFREGYGLAQLRADLLAGAVVGVVALPLSMALAIAVGVPPQHGLYTAIVAGATIAILGGSRVQVSGPTAAFVVVLAPITTRHGLGGLLIATVLAGGILMIMSLSGLGRLIELVPYPVTAGFTAGIGIVIATLQLKDFLGLTTGPLPEHFVDKVGVLLRSLPSARGPEIAIGVLTLVILVGWPHLERSVPAPLVGLATGALVAAVLPPLLGPEWTVATIGTRFTYEIGGVIHTGIPRLPPLFAVPWSLPGGDGAPIGISLDLLRDLLPAALTIAVLGAIESLLSAVVADGMIRREHDPDVELFAQGIGNLIGPFFGGIAATGAIARTATNVRSGGRSPIAALAHSTVLLAAVLLLAPWLGYLPMASLAALLLVVAWNMSELPHVVRTARTAPRSDATVLLVCLVLTVIFDMAVAVTVGIVLAALLFMRRMAEVSEVTLIAEPHRRLGRTLPPEIVLYEVTGPLFFGAAARAMRTLHSVDPGVRAVVLDLRSVPVLDATGLVNLESAVERMRRAGVLVVLAGVDRQPLRALIQAGWRRRRGVVAIRRHFDRALDFAIEHVRVATDETRPVDPAP